MPKPRNTNKIKLDPVFPIPEGAEELFVYSRDLSDTDWSDAIDVTSDTVDTVLDVVPPPDAGGGLLDFSLDTPTFTIVSQTLRRAPGGQQVVDVVIAIDSVKGATSYDVQVVKI